MLIPETPYLIVYGNDSQWYAHSFIDLLSLEMVSLLR